jgi:hypothetical protein
MIAGPGHGSTLGFDIGDRRKLTAPFSDPGLSEERRLYEGEFGLFIECAWRFERAGKVICGSRSPNETYADMAAKLECVVGTQITDIRVDSPSLDFSLSLGELDSRLAVFCDEVDPEDGRDNYFITLEHSIVGVGPESIVRSEECAVFRPSLRLV